MSELWPAVAGFGRWWAGELKALIPSSGRVPVLGDARRADIRPARAALEIVRYAKGQGERFVENKALSDFDEQDWAEAATLLEGYRTRILLKAPLIHVLTLRLPKAARPHLRSAIPLQLRDHAPLLPELLEWAIVGMAIDDDRLIVSVVIVRISTLDEIADGFLGHDMALPPIFAEVAEGHLVRLRPGRRAAGSSVALRPWWIAGALLASTPLWMLATLHLLVVDQQSKVAAAEALAQPKLAAEKRLRDQAELGRALKVVLASAPVTGIVEDLAGRLPSSTHAVDISAPDAGPLAVTLRTSNVELAARAITADPQLADVHPTGRSTAADGTTQVSFTAMAR